jgi:hypothetical protein
MVPSGFVWLDGLPLTSSGKLDRGGLPAAGPVAREGGYRAPRDGIEGAVAELWEELLGVDRVGLEDDFFALGGHSLLATRLVSRLGSVLGVTVAIRDVFEHSTLVGLSARVSALSGGSGGSSVPALARVVGGPRAPVSPGQLRLWFLDR